MALPGEGGAEPHLVADDQVFVTANSDGRLLASPPATIAGKIEVRGLGIMEVPFLAEAVLVLICDLVSGKEVPRMTPAPEERTLIAGVPLPTLKLAPFEASAAVKLKMALLRVAPDNAK
jgi:serine kinase of HPr protein (carbohydrate metabolism regulator)